MPIMPFEMPTTIYYGRDCMRELRTPLTEQGVQRVLIVTDEGISRAGLVEQLEAVLREAGVRWEVWTGVEPEPGIESIDRAAERIGRLRPDAVIALGGGSSLDSAKLANAAEVHGVASRDLLQPSAITRLGRPVWAVPTTSGTGSEVTAVSIVTVPDQIVKVGVVHPNLRPRIACVDPSLTDSLPPKTTAVTAVDALSHALESLVSPKASAISELFSSDAIRRIVRSLPRAFGDGTDAQARDELSLASLFAGVAFSNAGVGAVHAIAYPLGGRYHISHGECISLLLAEVFTRMLAGSPGMEASMARVVELMGRDVGGLAVSDAARSALEAIRELVDFVGLSERLGRFQLDEEQIEEMARTAAGIDRLITNSPRKLSAAEIGKVYRNLL